MKPYAKLYVSSDEVEGIFGDGKYELLNAVREHKSISKAAHALGRSYRKAWGDIKKAETALGQPLVTKLRGGRFGGQTVLTEYCNSILKSWELYRSDIEQVMNTSFKNKLRCLLGESKRKV
jgi:molybdate transport system regulatory protein